MEKTVTDHYGSDRLIHRIRAALKKAGKNPDNLNLKDLSIIDQLHTGGHKASLDLGGKAGLTPNMQLLDAGCGIGGTPRLIARTFGCRVTGIDLVEPFIEAAKILTKATGMEEQINFCQGDITSLPFLKNSFDAVWCQHTLMNIADKNAAISNYHTILKPGGLLILHEIVKGKNSPLHFPVPWADSPAISFLEPWTQMLSRLEKTGFSNKYHQDCTPEAERWWQRVKSARSKPLDEPSPLGPHIIFEKNAKHFGETMTANLEQQCIHVIEAVFEKKT